MDADGRGWTRILGDVVGMGQTRGEAGWDGEGAEVRGGIGPGWDRWD